MAKNAFVHIHEDVWVRPLSVQSVAVLHPDEDDSDADDDKFTVRVKLDRWDGWGWTFHTREAARAFMAEIMTKLFAG